MRDHEQDLETSERFNRYFAIVAPVPVTDIDIMSQQILQDVQARRLAELTPMAMILILMICCFEGNYVNLVAHYVKSSRL
jgi:hypothetical protein